VSRSGHSFRGSYTAIRAPSVSELFDAQNIGLIALRQRPVRGPRNGVLQACLNTTSRRPSRGLRGALRQRDHDDTIPQAVSGQLAQVQGGNPALQPEEVQVVLVRLAVLSDRGAHNLSGSVDFWQVRVEGEVNTYPPTCW